MQLKGPFDREAIDRFLGEACIPVRLSCNRASGFPLVASHWFIWEGGSLWCAVQEDSAVANLIARDGRCGFEVSRDLPPYFGLRGCGEATLQKDKGEETLRLLIDRYLGDETTPLKTWLLARAATETAVELKPETLFSWDYRARMTAG